MEQRTDVLIIGGGLIGLATAAAMGKAGVDCAVVDTASIEANLAAEYDGRCSAIALTAANLLQTIGAWDAVADEAQPINEIRVTEQDSPLFLHFDHQEVGDTPLGYLMENRMIRIGLEDAVKGVETIKRFAPARVEKLERTGEEVTAILSTGDIIKAQLVVAADGRRSQVRKDAGIQLFGWDYKQVGIVCSIEHERPHHGLAVELFRAPGPFAILPLTQNRCSIVWTESAKTAPAYVNLPEDEFNKEIQHRVGDFLGKVKVIGPRWSYPVSMQHAVRYTDRRLALAGDSAHGMHYIAGQGYNLGLRDVAALSELVVDAKRLGLDVGSPQVLNKYQQWRGMDGHILMAVTDHLNKLFSNDITPLKIARDLGLGITNRIPFARKFFMTHAMGMKGELPKLLKGEAL